MRSMLVLYSVFAVMLTTSACDNGDDPDEIPRTVPPTSVPSTTVPNVDETTPIKGAGPVIHA